MSPPEINIFTSDKTGQESITVGAHLVKYNVILRWIKK